MGRHYPTDKNNYVVLGIACLLRALQSQASPLLFLLFGSQASQTYWQSAAHMQECSFFPSLLLTLTEKILNLRVSTDQDISSQGVYVKGLCILHTHLDVWSYKCIVNIQPLLITYRLIDSGVHIPFVFLPLFLPYWFWSSVYCACCMMLNGLHGARISSSVAGHFCLKHLSCLVCSCLASPAIWFLCLTWLTLCLYLSAHLSVSMLL